GVGTHTELKIAHCVHKYDLNVMVKMKYKFENGWLLMAI
ncbi:MAG: hypothetical protein RLZZ617_805, partial [Bacteroidota bacterium]